MLECGAYQKELLLADETCRIREIELVSWKLQMKVYFPRTWRLFFLWTRQYDYLLFFEGDPFLLSEASKYWMKEKYRISTSTLGKMEIEFSHRTNADVEHLLTYGCRERDLKNKTRMCIIWICCNYFRVTIVAQFSSGRINCDYLKEVWEPFFVEYCSPNHSHCFISLFAPSSMCVSVRNRFWMKTHRQT